MIRKLITHIKYPVLIALIVLCLLAVAQAATGNIDATDKWAWGTNVGWINFVPTHGGVTVYYDHLEGYAWAENIGWIRLGSYDGGGAHTYANDAADTYGVNNDGVGNLSGYAWGSNVGWINFDPTHGGVTIDPVTGSFDGYAWGENIGWIHFKNASPAYNVVTSYHPTDLGDAPDPDYPTLLISTGASHVLGSDVYLGTCVYLEADGQPSAASTDDDTNIGDPVFGTVPCDDDKDGVTFTTPLRIGKTADIKVVAHAACTLSAWIDFNANGDWSDAGEDLFPGGQALTAGTNSLSFAVPADAVASLTHARFRCTTVGAVTFTGQASDGEVEDYQVRIACVADLDGNGKVNLADLSILVSQWGVCAGCPADLNGNGWVNLPDLSILVSQWGDWP